MHKRLDVNPVEDTTLLIDTFLKLEIRKRTKGKEWELLMIRQDDLRRSFLTVCS